MSLPLETQWRCLWSLWRERWQPTKCRKGRTRVEQKNTKLLNNTNTHSSIALADGFLLLCVFCWWCVTVCVCLCFFSRFFHHFFIIYIRLNLSAQIQMVADITKNRMKMIAWNIRQNTYENVRSFHIFFMCHATMISLTCCLSARIFCTILFGRVCDCECTNVVVFFFSFCISNHLNAMLSTYFVVTSVIRSSH